MTNKVQKIKDWISKEQDGLMDANGNFEYPEHEGAYHILCNLDTYIDSLQEEPVSEDLEEEIDNYVKRNGYDGLDSIEEIKYIAQYFTKWQKTKDDSCTSDLGDYINELSKQFPEVSFAKLSRIAVRVAKWQAEQMMAKAVDGKVIANGMGNPILHLWDKGRHLIGKKVKVIVIKED